MNYYKDGDTMYQGAFAKVVLRTTETRHYTFYFCEVVRLTDNKVVAATRDCNDAGLAYKCGMNAYCESKAF